MFTQEEWAQIKESDLKANTHGLGPEQAEENEQEHPGFAVSMSISTLMSSLGPSAVSEMARATQASSLLSPSFSFCYSISLS